MHFLGSPIANNLTYETRSTSTDALRDFCPHNTSSCFRALAWPANISTSIPASGTRIFVVFSGALSLSPSLPLSCHSGHKVESAEARIRASLPSRARAAAGGGGVALSERRLHVRGQRAPRGGWAERRE